MLWRKSVTCCRLHSQHRSVMHQQNPKHTVLVVENSRACCWGSAILEFYPRSIALKHICVFSMPTSRGGAEEVNFEHS